MSDCPYCHERDPDCPYCGYGGEEPLYDEDEDQDEDAEICNGCGVGYAGDSGYCGVCENYLGL